LHLFFFIIVVVAVKCKNLLVENGGRWFLFRRLIFIRILLMLLNAFMSIRMGLNLGNTFSILRTGNNTTTMFGFAGIINFLVRFLNFTLYANLKYKERIERKKE
jgi:hypothetical protein